MDSFLSQKEVNQIGFASVGDHVQISRHAVFYNPGLIHIASNVRIDDFSIVSTSSRSFIGNWVHIAAYSFFSCRDGFQIGDYCSFSPKVSVFGQTDDFTGRFKTHPGLDAKLRNTMQARMLIANDVVVGASSILLPGAKLSEGVSVGALSLVNFETIPWTVYAGVPARALKLRN